MAETASSVAFEGARLELARLHLGVPGNDCRAAVRHATRICAESLRVERVGLWWFCRDHAALECRWLHLRSTGEVAEEEPLLVEDYPTYFRAVRARKAVVAADALADRATRELARPYLEPRGIGAMLDAPVFVGGEVAGIVCHEHVGGPREWTQAEVDFASSVADMISIIHGQARRLELEGEVHAMATRNADLAHLVGLGRVARGVAHDFRNVLQPVRVALDLQVLGVEVSRDTWKEVLDAVEVGMRLADQLTQASAGRTRARTCSPDQVIAGLAPLLQRMVHEDASLSLDLGAADVQVPLAPTSLEQVVLNLVTNAADAVRDAGNGCGSIHISTSGGEGSVQLAVHDDGVGMSEALRRTALLPFVSTKPGGTGIGLATVDDLIRGAGGHVDIESVEGGGTTMCVHLPAVADDQGSKR